MSIRIITPITIPAVEVQTRLNLVVRGIYDPQSERWTLTVHYGDQPTETIPGQLETGDYTLIEHFRQVVFNWTATAAEHHGVGNWSFELQTYEAHSSIMFTWVVLGV